MKIIEVVTDEGHIDTILSVAEHNKVHDVWHHDAGIDGRHVVKILVPSKLTQTILDALQKPLQSSALSRVVIYSVEASIPRRESEEHEEAASKTSASREELYQTVVKNAQLDRNYVLLVIFSTIVAALGMLEDNIAVVIGAMVIAPLLSPNIALALGTVLGDHKLIVRATATLLVGILIAMSTAMLLTLIYPVDDFNKELLDRTNVGFSTVTLAMASGAAAALSMTTGLSTVLVGVMVAVAILPPTAALGLMLGYQEYVLAFGAFMLLAINIVCINLSADMVFLFKRINPRTRKEQQTARKYMIIYLGMWIVLLVLLVYVLYKYVNPGLVSV